MPLGLTNALSNFKHLMNTAFHDVLNKYIMVYLDDFFVYSETAEDHAKHYLIYCTHFVKTDYLLKKSNMNSEKLKLSILINILAISSKNGPD